MCFSSGMKTSSRFEPCDLIYSVEIHLQSVARSRTDDALDIFGQDVDFQINAITWLE